jgi:hypothetical protein
MRTTRFLPHPTPLIEHSSEEQIKQENMEMKTKAGGIHAS